MRRGPWAPVLGLALVLLLGGVTACSGTRVEPADLLLWNGKIVTLDPERPEATALAARGGKIVAVGDLHEVDSYRGPQTTVLDLDGHLAIPGFIEGHAHFTGLGKSLLTVDLRGARSWPEVVDRVAAAAGEFAPGAWILGRGWHQEKWVAAPIPDVEGYPVHDGLSRAVPDHPVILTHASGHAAFVNERAMERAGIDAGTRAPAGGEILRGPDGNPTGLLRETAEELVLAAYRADEQDRSPGDREASARREIELADRECLSKGITSFQDAGSSFDTVERLRIMAEAGEIGVRLWVMLNEPNDALAERIADFRMIGAADDHLTVRAVKRWIDGALGAHGAWLLEPYADQPHSTGHNTYTVEDLERTARIALDHDLQLCVHAIGDRGNRETLDVYQRAAARRDSGADLRWRVEHAQHLHPDDLPRFAELGVIASMQGIHCTSDGPWVPVRLGEERAAAGAYVWRSLLDSGAVVSNGTDAPVEPVDPIPNFHALVTRRTADGSAFHAEQVMTRMEALRASTINAAYAAFEEQTKGSLTPGKLADITVLSRDILTVPEERIPGTEVLHTIVGGELLYSREGP